MVNKYNFNALIYGALSEKIKNKNAFARTDNEKMLPPDRIINNILNYSKSLFVYEINHDKSAFIMN